MVLNQSSNNGEKDTENILHKKGLHYHINT